LPFCLWIVKETPRITRCH